MKKNVFLLLLLTSITLCFATGVKMHISEISPENLNRALIPDMNGYVLVSESDVDLLKGNPQSRTLPEIFPGWPVSYTNSNTYNGPIYLNMDDDDELEIITGVGTKISALKVDGTPVPGWPVNLGFYIWGSPAAGDITGDGIPEIVATSRNNTNGNTGALYAFHLDGTPVDGFPVTQSGGGTMNACLADITGDGVMEILVNVRNHPDGWAYVYDGTGAVVDGWPQQLDTFPGAGISSGDITGDGSNEIVALSYESLYVFDNQGNVLDGFPVQAPGITYSYSSPILVDLEGNGEVQIVYAGCSDQAGSVFVVNADGSYRTGWPQLTDHWVFATVAIGDINGDGELDIVVGDQVSAAEPSNHIYAWDMDGNQLTGFPAGPTDAIYTQIGIADITGDENVNLVITSNLFAYGYDCYNHDGTQTAGWPLPCGTDWSSVTMQSTPVFGDFNNDGNLDMAGAATGFTSWLVELYLWGTEVEFNEDLAYMIIDGCDIQHSGVYVRPGQVMETVATPEFIPESGSYVDYIELEIISETEDAEIYYTLDESEPTEESLLYTEPVWIDYDVTVRARAYKEGWLPSEIAEAFYEIELSVDDPDILTPLRMKAYPNPFNPQTTIEFSTNISGPVRLAIYNTKGQLIRTLYDGQAEPGEYQLNWNGDNEQGNTMPSGVYYYRLITDEAVITDKMLLLK